MCGGVGHELGVVWLVFIVTCDVESHDSPEGNLRRRMVTKNSISRDVIEFALGGGMLTSFCISIILVTGMGHSQHGAGNSDMSWSVDGENNVPFMLDQMTAFADRDLERHSCKKEDKTKDYCLNGSQVKMLSS